MPVKHQPADKSDEALAWPPMQPAQTYLHFPLQPHQLLQDTTPADDLFVLAHLGVPRVDPRTWSVSIGGLVKRPLRLTLEGLKALPQRTVEAFLQCAGNPATPKVPARLVANVSWRGVDLAELLEEAGVEPEARFVWSHGLDRGEFLGVASGPYLKDLPLERVRAGGVLIAHELNGESLSAEHGFPARLVVPGFYGTNSVKWLYRIELADRRAQGPFTTTFYNDTAPGEASAQRPVWNIPPEAVIVAPAPGEAIALARTYRVWGRAWADAGVAGVEVSFDGGHSWSGAALSPPRERAWQRFSIDWCPESGGEVELLCRATDLNGRIQPAAGARNEMHRVRVVVRAAGGG